MSFSPSDLCDPIREARKTRNLSQKELADLAGIGKTAMFDLEHGNPGVRLNTLLAVLQELGMDLELILPETSGQTAPAKAPATPASVPTPAPSPEPVPAPSPVTESLPEHLL